jgi:hypothetical protein
VFYYAPAVQGSFDKRVVQYTGVLENLTGVCLGEEEILGVQDGAKVCLEGIGAGELWCYAK